MPFLVANAFGVITLAVACYFTICVTFVNSSDGYYCNIHFLCSFGWSFGMTVVVVVVVVTFVVFTVNEVVLIV